MAKRRKLEAPSAADLSAIEDQFRRETSGRSPLSAPIAQVAAESAQQAELRGPEERMELARHKADADRLRAAEAAGLIIAEIPLAEIDQAALIRDRVALDSEEMEELKRSIAAHGVRLPIEVFVRDDPQGGPRYGLLSGYRRYRAVAELNDLWGDARYGSIKAVVRNPQAMGGAFVAMVEENEVRSNLSHFERGRIAVLAVAQGVFATTEAAVDALFAAASKAKRSKIRSFALIFEELGDMLQFPEQLREADGLKIAAALRAGQEATLRVALEGSDTDTPQRELETLLGVVEAVKPATRDPSRGGRPRRDAEMGVGGRTPGAKVDLEQDGESWLIRLSGANFDAAQMRRIASKLETLLQKR